MRHAHPTVLRARRSRIAPVFRSVDGNPEAQPVAVLWSSASRSQSCVSSNPNS